MADQIEILLTIDFSEDLINQIREVAEDILITQQVTRQPEEIPAETWKNTEVLFTSRTIPEGDLAPNLRWVQFNSAGVDRWVDNPLFQNSDIQVTSLSGANASQVAEHIIEMMLALGHRLPELVRYQVKNTWPTDRGQRFTPLELRDATVGIVGYGSIGRQTAKLLNGFGSTILTSKADLKQLEDRGYLPEGLGDKQAALPTRIYPAEALRSMFKECDFVVVSVPLTDQTRGIIAKEQLAAMKPTAFLIDASRGGVVDQAALIEALQAGIIAGAALDVFPEEPLASDSPLWAMENVIITPHIAGISSEYDQRAVTLFMENLKLYLDEQPLLNTIDIQKGY